MTEEIEAGWYPNPENETELRWWDGEKWSDQIYIGDADTVNKPEKSGNPTLMFVLIVAIFIIACFAVVFFL